MRDKSDTRRITLNDWRKEKRQKLVNKNRKIDFDWFDTEFDEEVDCVHNIVVNSKCMEILFQYLCDQTFLTESMAKKNFESSIVYLKQNHIKSEEVIEHQFFTTLCELIGKPLISNGIKLVSLDLIQQIISNINIEDFEEVIVRNNLILSVMINFNTSDIELLTKSVIVMQELIKYSSRLLFIALENGYLVFVMKIVNTTNVLCQRKSTEATKSKRISEKKLNLIRHISESLLLVANNLYKTDVIRDLYPLFEKLIHFKDKKIVLNALSSLTVIVEQNPESLKLLNRYLILSMTELMSQNNENISSIVVHFWKLFNQRIGDNINSYKNLLLDSNLFKKLSEILSKVDSNRLVTETADLLTEFVDKFDNSFELLIGFDIYRSLINALSLCDSLCRRQVLTTISRVVDRIESYELLKHLLEIQIIESLAALLLIEDPNLTALSSQTLAKILEKSHEFGLKDIVVIRAQFCSLNVDLLVKPNI